MTSTALTKEEKNNQDSMNSWFQNCTPEQANAMAARQLDYQFEKDNLGSVWWLDLQRLGFQHNGVKYTLPKSAPPALCCRTYSGKEIYECMDQWAIRRRSSTVHDFCETAITTKATTTTTECQNLALIKVEREWWRDIRDELIFRKFHTEIEQTYVVQKKGRPTKSHRAATQGDKKSQNRKRQKVSSSSDPGAELFLHRHSKMAKRKHASSLNTTTEKLSFPTVQEYAEMVRNNFNFEEVCRMEESYRESYPEWRFLCALNRSLLLYGVGSKRVLLDSFATELEQDGDVLTLEGFDKDMTVETTLDLLVNYWLDGHEPTVEPCGVFFFDGTTTTTGQAEEEYGSQVSPSDPIVQRAMAIAKALARRVETTFRPIYLVLHNIDGVSLRNPTAQEALSVLVHCSRMKTARSKQLNAVRLVASVDHVNGPIVLWDSLTSQRFRWAWKHVPTHRPYVEEVTQSTAEQALRRKVQHKRRVQAESTEDTTDVFDVLTSLAPRHTESLQMLAQLQLTAQQQGQAVSATMARGVDTATAWVNYTDLLRKCTLECTVTGDHQLRLFLKEFVDHEIVERKDNTGQSLRIPYSADTLIQIMNFEHDEKIQEY